MSNYTHCRGCSVEAGGDSMNWERAEAIHIELKQLSERLSRGVAESAEREKEARERFHAVERQHLAKHIGGSHGRTGRKDGSTGEG